ncbi:hypothetical protein A9Q97_06990 [Rhodospirillales bacterium 47_12_T64]|nr:hypothetical protein A9Q97_06990 [Rhodospirillales bacterium 47_12_T64]
MTRILKAVDRLAAAVDTLEKSVDTRLSDSNGSISKLQHDLDLSVKENRELKSLKQDVGDRLDSVIGQLSASLEK